jgi:hypothetical protein
MTRRTITLKAKPAFKHKYHSLLRKEWSIESHLQVLNLLDELLEASRAGLKFAWEKTQPSARPGKILLGLPELEELLNILASFNIAEPFAVRGMPALPVNLAELLSGRHRLVATAVRTWVYLNLQALFDLRGETGFFRDLQSMLFLHSTEWLLRDLRSRKFEELHSLLIHALGYHIVRVWPDNPGHQQYLLSAWASYLGDRELEENALRSAFRLSGPDEHDYLTLAQSYWQLLVEDRRYEDAEKFLLGIYREAPREQLDEIKGLLDDTYAERGLAHA